MAKFYDSITPDLQEFIQRQQMFFVATAPLRADGHVNCSPKGLDSFHIFSENRVGYIDMTGSGNETSAHLEENGRITFMFCAFEGPPNILRLYGTGRTIVRGTDEWQELVPNFQEYTGVRQIILADIHKVQTSCGFAVPHYEYTGQRDTLIRWAENRGADGLQTYWHDKNMQSLDKLPTTMSKVLE